MAACLAQKAAAMDVFGALPAAKLATVAETKPPARRGAEAGADSGALPVEHASKKATGKRAAVFMPRETALDR
jgi:hypothetical protein